MDLYNIIVKNSTYKKILEKKAKQRARIVSPYLNGAHILDWGCGNLLVAKNIIETNRNIEQIIGLDRTDYSDMHLTEERIKFVKGEGKKLPFSDNYFDMCYEIGALHHNPSMKQILDELWRVTKPEGKIIISEEVYSSQIGKLGLCLNDFAHNFFKPNPELHYQFKTKEKWINIFTKSNFSLDFATKFKVHLNLMNCYLFSFKPNK